MYVLVAVSAIAGWLPAGCIGALCLAFPVVRPCHTLRVFTQLHDSTFACVHSQSCIDGRASTAVTFHHVHPMLAVPTVAMLAATYVCCYAGQRLLSFC